MPTLYLLSQLFADDGPLDAETKIHLLDYNRAVLELVTLPNIILAWCASPGSQPLARVSHLRRITQTCLPPLQASAPPSHPP